MRFKLRHGVSCSGPPNCSQVEAGGIGGSDKGQAHESAQASPSGMETSHLLSLAQLRTLSLCLEVGAMAPKQLPWVFRLS